MTWYHGPVTAIIHDLAPPRAHATAMGIYYCFVNLTATTLASLFVGRIADRYSLLDGMHCAVVAQVVGGICLLAVIQLIRRDHSARVTYGMKKVEAPDLAVV